MSGLRFTATLERQGPGTFITVPLDLREKFGRARPPVRVTINGHTYRSTPGIYDGIAYLPVNKANRAAAGVEAGDIVEVALALDTEPRAIDVPADLRAALDVDGRWLCASPRCRSPTAANTSNGSKRPSAPKRASGA